MAQEPAKIHATAQRLLDAARLATEGEVFPVRDFASLAERLGVSKQALNNWKRRGVSMEGAVDAQRDLTVSMQFILYGDGPWLVASGANPPAATPLSRGAPIQAHRVIQLRSENAPSTPWENLKLDKMPQRFTVIAPDDAMDYPFGAGAVLSIERTSEPRAGRVMLIKDAEKNHYVRKITEKRPGHWLAVATGGGYDTLDSITEKLEVVGIVTGATWEAGE